MRRLEGRWVATLAGDIPSLHKPQVRVSCHEGSAPTEWRGVDVGMVVERKENCDISKNKYSTGPNKPKQGHVPVEALFTCLEVADQPCTHQATQSDTSKKMI